MPSLFLLDIYLCFDKVFHQIVEISMRTNCVPLSLFLWCYESQLMATFQKDPIDCLIFYLCACPKTGL